MLYAIEYLKAAVVITFIILKALNITFPTADCAILMFDLHSVCQHIDVYFYSWRHYFRYLFPKNNIKINIFESKSCLFINTADINPDPFCISISKLQIIILFSCLVIDRKNDENVAVAPARSQNHLSNNTNIFTAEPKTITYFSPILLLRNH
jgi:hypothetical protein